MKCLPKYHSSTCIPFWFQSPGPAKKVLLFSILQTAVHVQHDLFLYREVVEKSPSTQSYLLLGDAYMAITEPERALEVYEQALKRNPRDTTLAAKMGKALQRTHQYGKAINYYKVGMHLHVLCSHEDLLPNTLS